MVHKRMHLRLFLMVCPFLVFALFFHLVTKTSDPAVSVSDNDIKLTDFAYHILVIRAFWVEGLDNIYLPDYQMAVLSGMAGRPVYRAMPIEVTPIAAVLWDPFAIFAGTSIQLAN